ncbi:conserved hypothetical protein [Ricinus communis]|uniref:Uncharacterized protein n=1 Tax=Ricinus communis TaxID=3988 RepID=B9R6Y9_RICCO|nr:conserved hypothetical protein [Ricinus communis]
MEKQKNTQNLPSNYITLFELQKRWKKQQEDRKQQNEKKQQQEEDHASNDMIHVQAQERKQKKKKKKKKQQEQEQNDRNRQNYPKKHPNFTESSCEACHDEKQNDAVDVVVSVVEGNESEINLKEEAKGNDLGLRKKNKWNQKKRGKVTAREAHAPLKEYISAKTNGNISVKRYEKGKETSPKSTTDEAAVKRYEKEKEKSPKSTTQEAAVHRYEKRKETSPTPTTEEAVLKMYEKRKETSYFRKTTATVEELSS